MRGGAAGGAECGERALDIAALLLVDRSARVPAAAALRLSVSKITDSTILANEQAVRATSAFLFPCQSQNSSSTSCCELKRIHLLDAPCLCVPKAAVRSLRFEEMLQNGYKHLFCGCSKDRHYTTRFTILQSSCCTRSAAQLRPKYRVNKSNLVKGHLAFCC